MNLDVVLCFDRDYTVDVNPHPRRAAVPLQWVKHWAHGDPDVHVWATGNQHLRYEAAIPGVARAKQCRDIAEGYPATEQEDYRPARRERLRVIADLYESGGFDGEYIVVDDANLSDMESEGWQHYFPWEFVDAVEDGSTAVTVPSQIEFSNTPVNDDDCSEELETAQHYCPDSG